MKRIMMSLTACIACMYLSTLHATQADRLLFAVDVIRHGDRMPVTAIPKSPYPWPLAFGELTQEGAQQEYHLGQQKALQYQQQTHLLPQQYDRSTVLVRSTDFNRTLMSAESFLMGLYPLSAQGTERFTLPFNYQPIPIHTVSADEENLLNTTLHKNPSLKAKYFTSQKTYQDKIAILKSKAALWQSVSGLDVNDPEKLVNLADNLFVRKIHHVPFPPGITPAMADDIMATGEWFSVLQFAPYEIGMTYSKNLLKTIANHFEEASQHKTPLKLVLFSGHDDTLLSVLSALKIPQTAQPHYASDLNFLLFQNSAGEYYVKVIYNGKTLELPDCKRSCSLAEFSQLTVPASDKHIH